LNSCSKSKVLTLATTTSTENSGLLKEINQKFEKETGIKIKVIALGTGAAIKTAQEGNADLILVHARSREDKFVAEGFGVNRKDVMYNDFVLIGPSSDPAGIKGMKNVVKAFKKIASSRVNFASRGDDSGTHIKEQLIWKASGLKMVDKTTNIVKKGKKRKVAFSRPKGDWYHSIGQGMGNTIVFAYEKNGYTLADRGTFLAYKEKVGVVILSEGDKRLFNPYGIIAVSPEKHKHVKHDLAMNYINWMVSPVGQKLIGGYKVDGDVLFHPSAK
jgi:tungstate transport system substrate-binding protein